MMLMFIHVLSIVYIPRSHEDTEVDRNSSAALLIVNLYSISRTSDN